MSIKADSADRPFGLEGSQAGRPSAIMVFLRFGGLSGLGWLLDFSLLYVLVTWGHLPVFGANLVSATVAATAVFLLSRVFVFSAQSDFVLLRVLIYCAYTLVIIVLASIAMKYVAAAAASAGSHYGRALTAGTCAMIAKVVVTPVNFLLNFLIARITSEHGRTDA